MGENNFPQLVIVWIVQLQIIAIYVYLYIK